MLGRNIGKYGRGLCGPGDMTKFLQSPVGNLGEGSRNWVNCLGKCVGFGQADGWGKGLAGRGLCIEKTTPNGALGWGQGQGRIQGSLGMWPWLQGGMWEELGLPRQAGRSWGGPCVLCQGLWTWSFHLGAFSFGFVVTQCSTKVPQIHLGREGLVGP